MSFAFFNYRLLHLIDLVVSNTRVQRTKVKGINA